VGLFYLLVARQSTVRALLPPFIISSLVALLISVPLDSYFWQKPVWPELWAFYFNAVQGKSSEWGTESWYYYFVNALPRLLLNPLTLVLIPLAIFLPGTRRQALGLVIPSLLFVAIYSLQPHKEPRFVIYVSPPLTAAAAMGANALLLRAYKISKTAQAALAALLCLSVLGSLVASTAMLLLSSLNYPGGDALQYFSSNILPNDARAALSVHTDVLSCMTGVTLFAQNRHGLPRGVVPPVPEAHVYWDKTEDEELLAREDFWRRFDYVLAEDISKVLGAWEVLAVVDGFAGVEMLKPGMPSKDADVGRASDEGPRVGKGPIVRWIREQVRGVTGGWWVGPKLEPRVRILKRKRVVEAV
jgi:alpha-1,6-mannosyltransferase